jgi:hypothetical protein
MAEKKGNCGCGCVDLKKEGCKTTKDEKKDKKSKS